MVPTDASAGWPTLLLTRPMPQSQRFAAQVRDRFGTEWPIVISPLMQVQFLAPPKNADAADGAIFSSENGVAAVASSGAFAGGNCYCVGQRTAAAARALGWNVVLTGDDAAGLVAVMLRAKMPGRLVHYHGLHVAGDLVQRLNSAGIETVSALVYDQHPCQPTVDAVALLAQNCSVMVPLFSARSAILFQQVAANSVAPLLIAALSAAVVGALTLTPVRIKVAQQPDSHGMLLAMAALLNPFG